MIIVCILASLIVVVSASPGLSFAQNQSNFVATLSGKNMQPPVSTPATGTAKLSMNPNGTMSYEVDANNINQVLGVPLMQKNGTILGELLNVYANTGFSQGYNRQQAAIPTGPINGRLTAGVLTSSELLGPLFGKNVTDLVSAIKSGGVYVAIRTTPHQQGEIRGQIMPSAAAPSAAAPSAAAPSAAAPSAAAPSAAAPGTNSSAAAPSAAARNCVSNLLTSWTSNFTSAHGQLVDKIATCFAQP
jgi:hypothetical protein